MCQGALLCKIVFHDIFIETAISNDKNINASKVSEYYSISYIQTHGKRNARKHHWHDNTTDDHISLYSNQSREALVHIYSNKIMDVLS